MRRVRIALFVLAVGACGKGGGGSAPSASSGSAVATAAPTRDDAFKSVSVTELAAGTRADNISDGLVAVLTNKAIVVDGRAMVAVSGGVVDPAEVEGGANGLLIPRLKVWAATWRTLPNAANATVLLAVEPSLPARVGLQVISSFSTVGQRDFAFIVRTPDGPGAVPLHLPKTDAVVAHGPGAAPPENPDDQPIQIVLSVTPTRALLWSISGLEGTIAAPKLELTPAAGGAWLSTVRDTLADIVNRRWGGGRARPDAQKTIIVMVDPSLATSDLVAAIAAVRHDAKGQSLYPDVMLSMGFEDMPVAKTPPVDPPAKKLDQDTALEEEAARYAAALVASDDDDSNVSDMSKIQPGADLGAQIAAVRDGDDTMIPGSGRGPHIDGPTVGSGSDDSAVKTPNGRIAVTAKSAMDDTSLDVDTILRKIQSVYMMGLKRCYKNGLKMDPTLRGRVVLSFRVNEAGRSVNGSVDGFNDAVDQCMEGLVGNWVFPRPKDADGEATDASFRLTFTLTPD